MTKDITAEWLFEDNMEYFERRVFYWKNALKIENVEYFVSFKTLHLENPRALWEYSDSDSQITITANEVWLMGDLSEEDIDKTAFHEVYESMFCQIYMYMENFYNEKMVNNLIHQIVRRAENSIYNNLK